MCGGYIYEMEQITHKVILRTVAGTDRLTSFPEVFDVPFTPTHIKFSNLYYDATNADNAPHVLSTNLITSLDNSIEVVHDGLAPAEAAIFTNTRPISGSYEFAFSGGGLNAGVFSMRVTFMR